MGKKPTCEDLLSKISALESENRRMAYDIERKREWIVRLERMLFGSKRDKAPKPVAEGPGLFACLFKEAYDEKAAEIEETARDIEARAQQRRRRAGKRPNRLAKYHYSGLEERTTTLLPEGVDIDEYEVIGKDVTRVLRRDPVKVWVEVIERPLFRHKADRNLPSPRIVQAGAPKAVAGGNHVGADMLSQLVVDKYVYHLPEYRQVRQYADMGVKLPTSTVNDWLHAVADKLYPLYEALGEEIRSRATCK